MDDTALGLLKNPHNRRAALNKILVKFLELSPGQDKAHKRRKESALKKLQEHYGEDHVRKLLGTYFVGDKLKIVEAVIRADSELIEAYFEGTPLLRVLEQIKPIEIGETMSDFVRQTRQEARQSSEGDTAVSAIDPVLQALEDDLASGWGDKTVGLPNVTFTAEQEANFVLLLVRLFFNNTLVRKGNRQQEIPRLLRELVSGQCYHSLRISVSDEDIDSFLVWIEQAHGSLLRPDSEVKEF